MGVEAVSILRYETYRPIVSERDNRKMDSLETALLRAFPVVELPLKHRFTPGLYTREIFMPAGALVTSKVHKTEHPYVVIKGRVSVGIPGVGVEHIQAPHVGITQPGTKRLLYIHEDTVWLTFHVLADGETGEEDLPKIEERIIERRELSDGKTNYEHWREMLDAQTIEGEMQELPIQEDYGGAP